MNKMNVVIGQSGGPTPVINASLRGAVEKALKHDQVDTVYGTPNGLQGILNHKLIRLNEKLPEICKASEQPGAILGTSRHPLAEEEYAKIIDELERVNAKIFCYIGGNGSSRTVLALHRYASAMGKDIRFVHVPKTIDNDLDGTDHCPGYGSASKFLSHTVQLFAADMLSLQTVSKVEIIEVMGGNRGWLPAASALFKKQETDYPDLVYLPDHPIDADAFLADVDNTFSSKGRSIIVIVPDHMKVNHLAKDPYATEDPIRGHNAGIGFRLSQYINRQLKIPTRVTVPNSLFRIASGFVSRVDYQESLLLGDKAIDYALAGYSGGMVTLERQSSSPYVSRVQWAQLDDFAGKEKTFPTSYWDASRHMPTPAFVDYLLPLIDQEEPGLVFSLN
jgi:6-phosphofructokinase